MRLTAHFVVSLLVVTLWVPWQMHQATSTVPDTPPYWYKYWSPSSKPVTEAACLALVKNETGRRKVLVIQWYPVKPDPPPDYAKWIGCLPDGFDPEAPPK